MTPPIENYTLTLAELCALLRRSVNTGRRHIAHLMASAGFPAPLPTPQGARKLWSRLQVEAWLKDPLNSFPGAPAPANDFDPAFDPARVAAAQAELLQRYGGGA